VAPLAKEGRSGAELQVLLGGSVCAEVDRSVDDGAGNQQCYHRQERRWS
jgi:hypothetical protein